MQNTDLMTDSSYLIIGTRRQFFFDDLLLEQIQNLTRRFSSPQKVGRAPVLQKDKPWEYVPYFTCNTWNVIQDPNDGLFKCWYEDWKIKDLADYVSWIRQPDGKMCLKMHEKWPPRYLYAQSTDGLHWEKPALGIVIEDGHDTNIVLGSKSDGDMVHCAYVLLDTSEKDNARRFKMLFEHRDVKGGDDNGSGVFRVASSGDGIHWDIWEEQVSYGKCGGVAGDVVTLSIDPSSGLYMANNRHPNQAGSVVPDLRNPRDGGWIEPVYPHRFAGEVKRRISRSQSSDLIHWSTPSPLIVPDPDLDNIDDEFYGMEQFQIGDDWVGLLNVFHNTDNTMDVQLTYSRNGKDFKRIRPGRPWLPLGEQSDSWDRGMVGICSKPILVGDELFVFHSGCKNHHDWWFAGLPEGMDVPESGNLDEVNFGLGLAKMKMDRFVSLAAGPARQGVLVTRPVSPAGNALVVNARCHTDGFLKVAIADGQGNVLSGFEKENCVVFASDAVSHQIRWKGKKAVPTEGFIKLHFFMQNADLFSFQFIDGADG